MPVPVSYHGVIARFAGKGCVALGFILGIYGLTETRPGLLKTGLALLVIGIVASAYGLLERLRQTRPAHDRTRVP